MSLQKLNTETLQYLFDGYLNNPGAIYDITEIANKYNQNVHEYGSFLKERNWIKDGRFLPTTFECSISFDGIAVINPEYINDSCEKLLSTLATLGGQQSLMELLDFEPQQYQRARDIANFLRDSGVIEVIYTHNDSWVSFTEAGHDYYQQNGAHFV